jgi:hypothetical protein
LASWITARDLGFGDAVLNFGDSVYDKSPERRTRDHVLRLAAYLLFAERVGLPTRHLLQNPQLFRLVEWLPALLDDGLVFVDVPLGCNSVEENVMAAAYADDAVGDTLPRARYLDQHSKYIQVFDATGMMETFREQFISDVTEGGPFRALLAKRFGASSLAVSESLEQAARALAPQRHDGFLAAMPRSAPSK